MILRRGPSLYVIALGIRELFWGVEKECLAQMSCLIKEVVLLFPSTYCPFHLPAQGLGVWSFGHECTNGTARERITLP